MNYALITGSSKGIGREMALCLAHRNYNLLLVARSQPLLEELARDLSSRYGVQVRVLVKDLAVAGAAREITDWVDQNQYPVTVLINNAGYGLWGNFDQISWEQQEEMLRVNVLFVLELTHRMIPRLAAREGKKYILNVGSMAGFMALPTLDLYSASKSLINNFTRGLSWELAGSGISVSLLAPGAVRTNFIARSGMDHMASSSEKVSMNPDQVAVQAINGMFQGKREIIPGLGNRLGGLAIRKLPRVWTEKLMASQYRKK